MDLNEAKALILQSVDKSGWVQRACTNKFVTIDGIDYAEPVVLEALEFLYREGTLVQVPSAGQAQTSIAYRRDDMKPPSL